MDMPDETIGEKIKGVAKEATGKLTDNEKRQKEGEAQQAKAQKQSEAEEVELEAQRKRQEAAGHKGAQVRNQD
jgi:uncharacterized protein YjbJ (UPF0337 family)